MAMPLDLPGAVHGCVVTRFPPEPSWPLDLGHCKAALVNEVIAAQWGGRWILRFDDTNPRSCSAAAVESYLREMPLLGLSPGAVSRASDHFAAMAADAAALLVGGFLYADDTPLEEMRAQRLARRASPSRDRPVADSLAAWREMQEGSPAGAAFCLRMRLDPGSPNGALRDPVAYRSVPQPPHYRTGGVFRVYPTYDYAAPWLDAAEGVTHALRTIEFRDRDGLYAAVQAEVVRLHPGWRASTVWEFSRIHMAFTPQAKPQQRALVSAGLVVGPSDPRLPTLAGLMRGGVAPAALRAFLLEQVTPARKETYHSWDKLWAINRRIMDRGAARHMAVLERGRVPVELLGGPSEPQAVVVTWKQGHEVEVVRCREVWLDQADAQALSEGDEVTLLAWGNAVITSIVRGDDDAPQAEGAALEGPEAGRPGGERQAGGSSSQERGAAPPVGSRREDGAGEAPGPPAATGPRQRGRVVAVTAELVAGGGDAHASRAKLHWVPRLAGRAGLLPLELVAFRPPVRVERVSADVDVVAAFDAGSRLSCRAWGDPSLLRSAHTGWVVQLQRKGFFVVDQVVLRPGCAAAGKGTAGCGGEEPPEAVPPVGAVEARRAAAVAGERLPEQCFSSADVERLVLFHIPDGRAASTPGALAE
ncbi:MAG: tRNA synthetases class I, catalytic domain-containing protein [Monoraphidium minutum]|nr:MAG: tRNA synthetases class I, catalytic domain-containing protein [Monoraphidium minutum]